MAGGDNWEDRRQHIRRPCVVTVRCHGAGPIREGRMLNISASGALFALNERIRSGERLRLEFPDLSLIAAATVRWGVFNDDARCWMVGCAFQIPLSEDQVNRLATDESETGLP